MLWYIYIHVYVCIYIVRNTYLDSLSCKLLNYSIIVKWNDSPKRYYDYYTYEKYTYSAALLAIMIGPSFFHIKRLPYDIIDDLKILSFTRSL